MTPAAGSSTRKLAIEAVERINTRGAYANLVLGPMLDRSGLDRRDRGLVTELVYGTVRARRACDWLVDRFLYDAVDPSVRAALQVGAYQLVFMQQAPHAAVSATVGAVPKKVRGLVNAILRRVADDAAAGSISWPDAGTELSYPDWIIDRLSSDHGPAEARAALERMNVAPVVSARSDGYIQDLGSQLVVDAVAANQGERILDLCAAPGGKATGMATAGAVVIAADRRNSRSRLVAENSAKLNSHLAVITADGNAPPFPTGVFDKILVDAPCSGLGTLRRRADARWRIDEPGVERLANTQLGLLDSVVPLLRGGGELIYSVCTVTRAETMGVATALRARHPALEPLPVGGPWRNWGSGGLLLPHDLDTDGMAVFRWRTS